MWMKKVHNILSVVDYQKRTTNFSSAKQGEHCIRNILMNWQYDTIVSVRKNLKSKGYDLDGLLSLEIVKEKERMGEKRKTENEMISEGQVKEKEATAEQAVPLPPRRRGMSR